MAWSLWTLRVWLKVKKAAARLLLFTMLGRDNLELVIHEDNQATILVKLRHIRRTHNVNLGCISEQLAPGSGISIQYVDTNLQAADIFTKALPPQKWDNALKLLGIRQSLPRFPSGATVVSPVMVDDQTRLVYVLHKELCIMDDIREAAFINTRMLPTARRVDCRFWLRKPRVPLSVCCTYSRPRRGGRQQNTNPVAVSTSSGVVFQGMRG